MVMVYCGLWTTQDIKAQLPWLPDQYLTPTSQICDYNDYKLVFFDHFNGTTLDNTKWNTFLSWNGMTHPVTGLGHDHEYTCGSRRCLGSDITGPDYGGVFEHDNVVVSGGTVKLKSYHKRCNVGLPVGTCAPEADRFYSAAALSTYYLYEGKEKSFNSGRFEVRAKFPDYWRAHNTIWLWYGEYMGVNELDMIEHYGPSRESLIPPFDPKWRLNMQRGEFNYHAWGGVWDELFPAYLPYTTQKDVAGKLMYPNQEWSNYISGTYLDLTQWHKYQMDWDTTVIKMYLNNYNFGTVWKYYRTKKSWWTLGIFPIMIGSGCTPIAANHKVTKGFPYRANTSNCQFRITVAPDYKLSDSEPTDGSTFLGEAEIDYVKIYQRHPEADGYTDLCSMDNPPSEILGSSIMCDGSTKTYSVDNPVPGGVWVLGPGLVHAAPPTSSSITITKVSMDPSETYIYYNYGPPECHSSLSKAIHCGLIFPYELLGAYIVPSFLGADSSKLLVSLAAVDNNIYDAAAYSYLWTVSYTMGAPTHTQATEYKGAGKYCHLLIPNTHRYQDYAISWELKRIFDQDTQIIIGNASSIAQYNTTQPNNFIFKGYIPDSTKYAMAIQERLDGYQFDPSVDSSTVFNKIGEFAFHELYPYITEYPSGLHQKPNLQPKPEITSKLYPNPADDKLTIQVGSTFQQERTMIYIVGLKGEVYYHTFIDKHQYDAYDINISNIPQGLYFLKLESDGIQESLKFIKK